MPLVCGWQDVEADGATMRDLVDRMLTMIDRGPWSDEGGDLRFGIEIAHTRIDFETMTPPSVWRSNDWRRPSRRPSPPSGHAA